jgi:hypothetical protein
MLSKLASRPICSSPSRMAELSGQHLMSTRKLITDTRLTPFFGARGSLFSYARRIFSANSRFFRETPPCWLSSDSEHFYNHAAFTPSYCNTRLNSSSLSRQFTSHPALISHPHTPMAMLLVLLKGWIFLHVVCSLSPSSSPLPSTTRFFFKYFRTANSSPLHPLPSFPPAQWRTIGNTTYERFCSRGD